MRGRRLGALFAPVLATVSVLAACNAIVGVEDVRLKKDGGVISEDGDIVPNDDGSVPETGVTRPNILEVALGDVHTCARKTDGTVKCWGDNTKSQIGPNGDGGTVGLPQDTGIGDAVAIAAGKNHTCVVRQGGQASCWGDNLLGQLGDGNTNTRSAKPVDVSGLTDAVDIAGGASFTCAVRATGAVVCWGDNLSGQLGNGTKSPSSTPTAVTGLSSAVAISAGEVHACAVTSASKVMCWGNSFNGQLGTGQSGETQTPVAVPALDDVIAVAAASRTTCALKRTGAVFCWGANEVGQLGSGAANPTPNPSPSVVSGVDATAIWAGTDHACALQRTGGVVCWGAGSRGQLGDGIPRPDASTAQPTPVAVSGISDAIGVRTGGFHSCAPTRTNAIRCWGANERGQLGEGTTNDEQTPISVTGYP